MDEYDIHLVPLQIVHEGKTYRDRVDINPTDIYRIMRRRENLPTTSNPLPADFLRVFKQVSKETESILCITVTSLQSTTFDIACMAKEMIRSLP